MSTRRPTPPPPAPPKKQEGREPTQTDAVHPVASNVPSFPTTVTHVANEVLPSPPNAGAPEGEEEEDIKTRVAPLDAAALAQLEREVAEHDDVDLPTMMQPIPPELLAKPARPPTSANVPTANHRSPKSPPAKAPGSKVSASPLNAPAKKPPLVRPHRKKVPRAGKFNEPPPEVPKATKWWFDPEGTMVAEIDMDGVPLGVRPKKQQNLPVANPRFVIMTAWFVFLLGVLYAAGDLRSSVLFDEELAQKPQLVRWANGFYDLAHAMGPAALREVMDTALAGMKQRGAPTTSAKEQDDPVVAGDPSQPRKVTFKQIQGRASVVPGGRTGDKTLRVLIIGASSIQYYLGSELERRIEMYKDVQVERFGKLGTGLARPDMFDWSKQTRKLIDGLNPHVVIAQFGGNDAQPLTLPTGQVAILGTPEWSEEYSRRVRAVIEMVNGAGAKMVMIGMPITRHKKHSDNLAQVNLVTKAATEEMGGVYLSTWDIASDAKGQYRETLVYNGKTGPMYLADGVHYARLGAAFVAEQLASRLERFIELVPADDNLAVAVRGEVVSSARNRTINYLAYVPQRSYRNDERIPVFYLLHGTGSSWLELSDRAHTLLRTLSTTHKIVIVTPDGDPQGWYVDSPLVEGARAQTFITEELLPSVERQLPVASEKSVGGIGMGGNGAIVLALKNPNLFLAASSLSGNVDLSEEKAVPALVERLGPYEQNPVVWESNSALHLIRADPKKARTLPLFMTVGTQDAALKENRSVNEALLEIGSTHIYKELSAETGWPQWLAVLPEHIAFHAQKLYGPKTGTPLSNSEEPADPTP